MIMKTIAQMIDSNNPKYLEYDFEKFQNKNIDPVISGENLLIIKNVFDKNKLSHWLCFGTLLGAKRENGFIKHDKDSDIALYYTDKKLLVQCLKELLEQGFQLIRTQDDDSLVSITRKGEYTDFYLFKLLEGDNKKYWHCVGYSVSYEFFNDFGELDFLNDKFRVPADTVGYLEETYGMDWGTPKENAHAAPNMNNEIYLNYFNVANKWLNRYIDGIRISTKLKQCDIHEVIIYGYGSFGKTLLKELVQDNVPIIGIVDKNITDNTIHDIAILKSGDLVRYSGACVIVTPFLYYDNIKYDLLEIQNDLNILNLKKLLGSYKEIR